MAFVSVPKDLNKIKSKLAFNMTKRQLICFGLAAVIGIPTYIFTRGAIGTSAAVILMMVLMLPLFFLAMYEKDEQPAEKVLRNIIRARFYWPGIRRYQTNNFYETLAEEGKRIATESTKPAKAPDGKHQTGKKQP